MKLGSPCVSHVPIVFGLLVLGVAWVGCKADQLTGRGSNVALLYAEPEGCQSLGVVEGRGGGLAGAYTKPKVHRESAENDARDKAAELGATHLLLHPEEVHQGDGRAPDPRDTNPSLAHGSGTGSTVLVSGTAYKCAPGAQVTKSPPGGSAFVAVQAPQSISLAPLGPLHSITVFQRVPLPSGGGMTDAEVLRVQDPAQIQRVEGSLQQVVEDPMKYIPTHRVELVGELGSQSLLYGFGYLQYAGSVYRLTDGEFEDALGLREAPTATPPAE